MSLPRRIVLAGAAAGLLAAVGLAFPQLPGGGTASAADCVVVPHSKKVVKRKKVRRHDRWVKVKRRKIVRWTTCEPTGPAAPTCTAPSSALGVTARDQTGSTFTLSRPCVTTGDVDVELSNRGEDPHNLLLSPDGPGTDAVFRVPGEEPFEVGPLAAAEETVNLTAGRWYLWCDLLTHEQQGMYAYLEVR